MDTRVAVIGIIVEEPDSAEKVNAVLHDHSSSIIGRMGIPYRERNISIISVAVDASQDDISSLCGRLGRISGVSVKAAYAKSY